MLLVEIIMFIGGLYVIIKGQIPAVLFGGGKYQIGEMAARMVGVLFILAIPLSFIAGIILFTIFGDEVNDYLLFVELAIVLGIVLLSYIIIRLQGQKTMVENEDEALIAKKAQGALMYAIFSATGVGMLIGSPLAFYYGSQAIKLIDDNGVGLEHRRKAQTARIIAGTSILLWVVPLLFLLITLVPALLTAPI